MTTQLDLLQRDWVDRSIALLGGGFLHTGNLFTSDDLRSFLDEPEHGNWYGVLMAKLRRNPRIRKVGYRASTRPEANGRVVAVWEVI